MPIDPLVGTLISTVGQGASSYANSRADNARRQQEIEAERRRLAEQQRQFNANLAEQQRQEGNSSAQKAFDSNINATTSLGDRAQSVNRELELMPLRDRASAMMTKMMGQGASQSNPRSLAGGGTDALRGGSAPSQMPYDLGALQKAAGSYQPGDGGMTGDVQKELLKRYMTPQSAPTPTSPSAAPTQAPAQKFEEDLQAADLAMRSKGIPVGMIEQTLKAIRSAPPQQQAQMLQHLLQG